ncbi:hypothetical protein FPV67DRAFT_1424886 [Lyophyllum atratum]|nr:hypothetical protein FPV67DRAFT_1424886 [Lyophyllum atratum]
MAPSLETSISACLPLTLASPVQVISDLFSRHRARKHRSEDDLQDDEARHTPSRRLTPSTELDYTPVRQALNGLASTSASFLVSNSPLTSSFHLPALQTYEISPYKRDQDLLDTIPETENERRLMAALGRRNNQISLQKQIIRGQQAQTILHSAHVEDLRGQLQGKEERKARGNDRGKINMDGQPKILTQDQIFNCVAKSQQDRNAAKDAAIKRKSAKTRYAEAIGIWKVREMDRKKKNDAQKAEWARDVRKWEVEKNRAKCERQKPRWTKPKMPPAEKAAPKPKVADFVEESDEDQAWPVV